MVQRQDLRLSGRVFQMRGTAKEKDLSPHECRDLGSMRRSIEVYALYVIQNTRKTYKPLEV